MNMFLVEFPVQVLEHAQIPRVVASDLVPGGLPDPLDPIVAQFVEASSSAACGSTQDPLQAPASTSAPTTGTNVTREAPALSPTRTAP
jgi:hypothetical protein